MIGDGNRQYGANATRCNALGNASTSGCSPASNSARFEITEPPVGKGFPRGSSCLLVAERRLPRDHRGLLAADRLAVAAHRQVSRRLSREAAGPGAASRRQRDVRLDSRRQRRRSEPRRHRCFANCERPIRIGNSSSQRPAALATNWLARSTPTSPCSIARSISAGPSETRCAASGRRSWCSPSWSFGRI